MGVVAVCEDACMVVNVCFELVVVCTVGVEDAGCYRVG